MWYAFRYQYFLLFVLCGFGVACDLNGVRKGAISAPGQQSKEVAPSSSTGVLKKQGPATQLMIASRPLSLLAGQCSDKVSLQTLDADSNPSPLDGKVEVDLSGSGDSITFFADPECKTPIQKLLLESNTGSADPGFYYKNTKAGTFEMTASTGRLTPAKQTRDTLPSKPVRLH